MRLIAGSRSLAYTGDAGPDDALVELARGADVLLAEATFADAVPEDSRGQLSSARDAGMQATRAAVGRLVLTHLQPGTDPSHALEAASRAGFRYQLDIAERGLVVDFD
jgi:ribonuclease BN (tRNA processing enzyme)